jgi:Phosphotransferase enzyme family
MTTRDLLGPADVTDAQLAAMVADLLGENAVEVLDVHVETVDYDLPAITTAGRWWVSGRAATRTGTVPFRIFVKHVQAWERHRFFQHVPEAFRTLAKATVPWRAEPLVYRSDLAERLPEGLRMPRALGVFDLDELSAAVWLEEVPARPARWDLPRYARAAYLLGRLAASPRVAPLAGLRAMEWGLSIYAQGRLAVQVVPMLESDDPWRHPLCAAFDEPLRERLRNAGRRAEELAAEADALPSVTSHGDACPNNLLAGETDEELVMIDFGFWGPNPVGYDLTALLVGDVQIGRRSAADLADIDSVIIQAYIKGLRAEGSDISEAQVRRGHALELLLMTGLSAMPFDLFEVPMTPETRRIAADRAELARYALDLDESTASL